ncbi:MAG: N-acetyl-gamma-glutamyl-phosphate reductase [Chloroflexota bacterium]|nr:N-acetyl-gamma-glutamyl-phosphate reductase [Chloroflexota bacterium]MDE3194183.1 N-acetyl-gamma-glutamyl-phosphate reductase [Chloroflexota bacterium]
MTARVAIVGATGYAGGELARILLRHPEVRVVAAVSRSKQGMPLREAQPHLYDAPDALRIGGDVGDAEVVFTTLPAGEAAKMASAWLAEGRRVIDVGSDFRLRDAGLYEKYYRYAHPAPELLAEAVYGLTEFVRPRLRGARLVANPGCYPTATLLALGPAAKHGLITDDVIVDAKSGVSGAGHSVDEAYLFGTLDSSVRAYGVPRHRHSPEIAQGIADIGGRQPRLTFTPHLVPMTRGLLATCYAPLRDGVTGRQVAEAYAATYAAEPFVRVVPSFPATKNAFGSNWCLVHAIVDEENRRLVAVGALDNLVKGAAGSAVQNMNALLGFPEELGLGALPLWP